MFLFVYELACFFFPFFLFFSFWTGNPSERNPRVPEPGGFFKSFFFFFAATTQPLTRVSAGFREPLA